MFKTIIRFNDSPVVNLPQSVELSKKQSKYFSALNKIQKEFKLKDSAGVADYHQMVGTIR